MSRALENNPATYTVQIENDPKSEVRMLHRNKLLLCDSLLDNFDCDLNLDNVQSANKKKEEKKKWCRKFYIKKNEFKSDKSDQEFIQITSLKMKTLEENSLDEQQKSDSNIEIEFTMDEARQESTGRSELQTEDRS